MEIVVFGALDCCLSPGFFVELCKFRVWNMQREEGRSGVVIEEEDEE